MTEWRVDLLLSFEFWSKVEDRFRLILGWACPATFVQWFSSCNGSTPTVIGPYNGSSRSLNAVKSVNSFEADKGTYCRVTRVESTADGGSASKKGKRPVDWRDRARFTSYTSWAPPATIATSLLTAAVWLLSSWAKRFAHSGGQTCLAERTARCGASELSSSETTWYSCRSKSTLTEQGR